ncbi:MAG TPA: hypothetical protein VKT53_14660 [Candidatus Acidoferrum sp.]|nr:hypothetical protein [Candidatus Acidoferrum sp.]
MATTIVRPTFYEGEVLPAADLVSSVDSARGQMARHDRYLHSWGIVTGLSLVGTDATLAGGTKYKTIVVQPGIAIDGTGREIVVPSQISLVSTEFQYAVNPKDNIWYPVFLTGQDEPAPPSANLTGACNTSLPTAIQENASIVYGSPGAELNLDQQTIPALTAGPADGTTSDPWQILLGFVSWSTAALQFIDVATMSPDSGIGPRYVGVNAASVVSQSGQLQLATHPASFVGQSPSMAMAIQESSGGQLIFGKQNPDGSITQVLTVTSKGDIIAAGKFTGAVTPGSVQVQSGIASDGMTIPLPIGIDPASVDAGKVTLSIHVTPHFQQPVGPSGGTYFPVPYECYVDDNRQIHCRLQWWKSTLNLADVQILPALCDYTVIAAVAASGS